VIVIRYLTGRTKVFAQETTQETLANYKALSISLFMIQRFRQVENSEHETEETSKTKETHKIFTHVQSEMLFLDITKTPFKYKH